MHVLATAGHVDHGKSSLVRVLTGTDPDRLAEEKARGLTIDLGFADSALPSGRRLSFVDVPGHVRFLRNMLAGVGSVDGCVFVVAATEGWKPQSEEHLRILDMLGLNAGVVAMTKIGLADDDLRELARLELEESLAGTFLESAEIIGVDSLTGEGIDDLKAALDRLTEHTPTAVDRHRPRLWIDRSFPITGSGTVVTGTLIDGMLRVGDELEIDPGGREVRIRGLQSLHAERTKVRPGNRVAVNLSGVEHADISRGSVLLRPGDWFRTQTIDARLDVLEGLGHPVSRRGAYLAYIGSGEHPVRLRVLGPSELEPGTSGFVRLHLPTRLPLVPGDRFILREAGRAETVGGGEILDLDPRAKASVATPDRSVERVIAERGWVLPDELELLTGERRDPTLGEWIVDPAALEAVTAEVLAAVEAADDLGLDVAGLSEHQRLVLASLPSVVTEAGRARPAGQADDLADHPWLAELKAAGFQPPPPDGVPSDVLSEMKRRELVVESDGIHFSPSAIEQGALSVARLLAADPDGVTVSMIKSELGVSRKYALPLVLLLDARGITRRRDDLRIAGPRLPRL